MYPNPRSTFDPYAPNLIRGETAFPRDRYERKAVGATAEEIDLFEQVHADHSPAEQAAERARVDALSDADLRQEVEKFRKALAETGAKDEKPPAKSKVTRGSSQTKTEPGDAESHDEGSGDDQSDGQTASDDPESPSEGSNDEGGSEGPDGASDGS